MDHSGNVLDYLNWRGDLTFAQDSFNEVDNLVLCIISYINFRRVERLRSREPAQAMTLGEVCALLSEKDEQLGLSNLDYIPVLRAASETVRFGAVRMYGYECSHDDEREMQFAAVSFLLPDETLFIAFMGTDRSLVGWKEDLNMSYLSAIPAQQRAEAYAEVMAATARRRKIRLGGHSKGGNLAVYSAAKSSGEIQERIVAVHNNDGPGFAWDISETPGHKRIASRIHTILPQTSVVGMLMEHEKRYQVVHSTYDGLYQHDGFSWQVLGTQFVHLDDFSREGKLVDETLSSWADSLNTQQREALADALYSVFTASGAKTLSELTEEKLKSAAAMLKTYKNLDRETRRMVTEAFMLFFKLGTKNFVLDTQEEGSREIENIRKKISEQYQKLVERKK